MAEKSESFLLYKGKESKTLQNSDGTKSPFSLIFLGLTAFSFFLMDRTEGETGPPDLFNG